MRTSTGSCARTARAPGTSATVRSWAMTTPSTWPSHHGQHLHGGDRGRSDEQVGDAPVGGAQPVGAGAERVRQPADGLLPDDDEQRPVVGHRVAQGDGDTEWASSRGIRRSRPVHPGQPTREPGRRARTSARPRPRSPAAARVAVTSVGNGVDCTHPAHEGGAGQAVVGGRPEQDADDGGGPRQGREAGQTVQRRTGTSTPSARRPSTDSRPYNDRDDLEPVGGVDPAGCRRQPAPTSTQST